ncbi:MAG: transglutaminase, partial [Flavobacterium sp.]
TIESPYITSFPDWEFQESIPVNYSEYKTSVPEFYTYSSHFKGFMIPKISKLTENKSLTFTSKERSDGLVVKTSFSTDKVNYMVNTTKYIEENLPAMRDEDYVNNIDNYKSAVVHELAMSKMPNSTPKYYSTDWQSVVKTIYQNDDFGAELNKTNYFEEDLKAVLAGITDKNEKINAVFNFVKARMNWNDYYGYSCDQGVKAAYKQKTGNIAEINLMLTAMLRHAGLSARPVLVSTRSNGISFFPNRTAYNYVIAAVEDDNKIILLDASDKFTQPNILPLRALNWLGKLIREDGSSVDIDLMPNAVSREVIALNYKLDATGQITGKLRKQYTDYNAEIFRQRFVGQKEEAYLESLENKLDKIEISEYKRDNEKEMKLPVVETFSFSGSGLCDVVGDKIYLSPMIFFKTDKNPFNQEKREYPVDFGFPFQDKYVIGIDLPEGYVLESMPKPINVQAEGKMFGFVYNIVASENKVQLMFTMDVNTSIVSSENYQALKDVFQKLVAKQNEKIVLKKV